jgi:hypothetical protein
LVRPEFSHHPAVSLSPVRASRLVRTSGGVAVRRVPRLARPEAWARARQPVARDATVPQQAAEHAELVLPGVPDAVEERPQEEQRVAAAERSAGAGARRREARDAARRQEEQRAEAALAWVRLREARPSAARLLVAASACHRDRLRLGLARQRAARFARATARQQTASSSKSLWRAAQDEILSCRFRSPEKHQRKRPAINK